MQTFPQSANGNRLFPDNRAPSWEILSCKSNSSLLLLLQDEAASALSRKKQTSGHIYPQIKCPLNLRKANHVRISVWEMRKNVRDEGLFLFNITKWWPMQRAEMTSRFDLHFTPSFERIVSVLCQFLHCSDHRPRGLGGSETEYWADLSSFFKSGARQIHT